jgi:tetratricopeptide (TPR) repeat protein
VADFNRALQLYEERAPDADRSCRLYIHRGDCRYHAGDRPGILSDYRKAFQLNPSLAAELVVARLARDIKADLGILMADGIKHLRLDPVDYVAYSRRGLVFLLQGRDADAQKDFERVVLYNPDVRDLLDLLVANAKKRVGGTTA